MWDSYPWGTLRKHPEFSGMKNRTETMPDPPKNSRLKAFSTTLQFNLFYL